MIPPAFAPAATETRSSAGKADNDSTELLALWRQHRVIDLEPPCIVDSDVGAAIKRLEDAFPGELRVEVAGQSFEERPIWSLAIGAGPKTILLWSQMHGDEPSATPALLDLVHYLLSGDDSRARRILETFTLILVPMLNPDGTERATRRSAQGIDINRDALALATPEGRLLKELRDRYDPFLGFNLHDQDRRKLVGQSSTVATQSVLAVAGDEAQTVTPGRERAMRVCSVLIDAFEQLIPGGTGRYDEDWSPRAFGDNVTAWGTPVVLLESGGLPEGQPFSFLAGLTFVGLVRALDELADGDAARFTIDTYRQLPRNRSNELVDVVVRGASTVVASNGVLRRSAIDLAFDVNYRERDLACEASQSGKTLEQLRQRGVGHRGSSLAEVGDMRFLESLRDLELPRRLMLPTLRVGLEGFEAVSWLNREVLALWASFGVGELIWSVEPEDLGTAQTHAEQLASVDLPRLHVSDALPSIRVVKPPAELPQINSWSGALRLLTGKEPTAETVRLAISEGRPLRRFAPASFVVLGPEQGEGALSGAKVEPEALLGLPIEAVWLEGREVGAAGEPR